MPEISSHSARLPAVAEVSSLPEVRLECSQGSGPAYVLSDVGFLIGTVPGCDMRVPGAGLPAVLCLITRRASGANFRKLAPTQTILINGQNAIQAPLKDGDRLTVGAVEVVVGIEARTEQSKPAQKTDPEAQRREREAFEKEIQERKRTLDERAAKLEAGRKELEEQTQALQADRVLWYQRREEIERECLQKVKFSGGRGAELANLFHDLEDREKALATRAAEVSRRETELDARAAELERQKQELATLRQELADIRRQLYERYQERRDRLAGLQEAINRAARKVQETKQRLDAEADEATAQRQELARRQAELQARAAEIVDLVKRLDEERRLFQESKSNLHEGVDQKLADLKTREEDLASARRVLDERQQQHQADLVRLDRLQATLDERERTLAAKNQEIDQRVEQMQRDGADLEEQVVQLDEWRAKLAEEGEQLQAQKAEQETTAAQLVQRAASLEGQQATLAALRTRLERMREEVRREEQRLAVERGRQENAEAELQLHLQESLKLRGEIDGDQKLRDVERQQMVERSAVLEAAVNQVRQAQDKLARQEENLRVRSAELDQKAAEQTEQAGIMQGRLAQLQEAQERLEAERQALRERTQALAQAEGVREKLQEQLRRRSEELATRQKEAGEQIHQLQAQAATLETRRAELEEQHQQAQGLLSARKQELDALAAELERRQAELQQREKTLEQDSTQVQEAGQAVDSERESLTLERERARARLHEVEEALSRQQSAFEDLRRQARDLVLQLPDLELRAGTALERLTHAREQLREHLGEIHTYARQRQDDLEGMRGQVQAEADRLQQRELALHRLQDEHRLAVADFRQQLIEWQGQVADKKRILAQDETRLERKQAQVSDQAKQIDITNQRLAQKVEQLQEQERAVAGRRHEIDRHLADMREWYRKKLRELAGVASEGSGQKAEGSGQKAEGSGQKAEGSGQKAVPDVEEDALMPAGGNILSLTGPVAEADQRLGDLLRLLGLVDAETLTALLVEARRQRRSLRQVLLTGGVVTLYQMALIEAGNVDALMLGPVRVVDRLRATPREAVYRVFDPRTGQDALLRHLAEAEMRDAGHADDFRQRFTLARLDHPHLARTLEVLEIAGRPAVLQEWLTGLACPEWPPLASVPGVCFRLLSQAALGLATAHDAGLVHGHLAESLLLLTKDGTLKICGLGEPPWLAMPAFQEPATPAGDLAALGKIAADWSTSGVRKGPKTKPLPPSLLAIITRLHSEAGYAGADLLLADLDRISADVPPNAEAWDRLLKYVRDHATPDLMLRQSA